MRAKYFRTTMYTTSTSTRFTSTPASKPTPAPTLTSRFSSLEPKVTQVVVSCVMVCGKTFKVVTSVRFCFVHLSHSEYQPACVSGTTTVVKAIRRAGFSPKSSSWIDRPASGISSSATSGWRLTKTTKKRIVSSGYPRKKTSPQIMNCCGITWLKRFGTITSGCQSPTVKPEAPSPECSVSPVDCPSCSSQWLLTLCSMEPEVTTQPSQLLPLAPYRSQFKKCTRVSLAVLSLYRRL